MTYREETKLTLNTETSEYLTKGTVIDGRYEVGPLLGEGGYGVVYRARQLSTGQFVALKVLRIDRLQEKSADSERGRFEREMKVIGQLNHVNIVKLIDFGTLPNDQLYSVIEYIDGVTLSDLLATEGALHPKEALGLMTQILDALGAVHALGIVYRDLKPQNIMVTSHTSRRSAKLLDFGISGIVKDARDDSYRDLTQDGKINGTPSYMSPEQLRSKDLTPQTDIYAWGLVFLELLLGRRVVDAESYVDILARQISSDPIPIPQELMQHPLGHILKQAVAKNLHERYTSARDALLDLESCLISPTMTLSTTGVIARQRLEASQAIRSKRGISATYSSAPGSWNTSSPSWDLSSEVSQALEDLGSPEDPALAPPKRPPLLLLLVPLSLLGGVALVWILFGAFKPTPTASEVAVAPSVAPPSPLATDEAPRAIAPPLTPPPTPAPPPKTLHLVSQVSPTHAVVKIDGKHVGTGSVDLRLAKPAASTLFLVQAKGYTPYSIDLNDALPPDHITLTPLPRRRPADRTKPAATRKKEPTPGPQAEVKPQDSKDPSPTWVPKTTDLEDPWAK